jgi:hypothetical protein
MIENGSALNYDLSANAAVAFDGDEEEKIHGRMSKRPRVESFEDEGKYMK